MHAVPKMVPPGGPIFGTVFQKWYRQAVPFLGPCLGSFFDVFCIRVAEAQSFGFNEILWLMATGRATREAAKPVLRKFSGPRIGSFGASCFVDDLVSCWGKRGAYRLLLEPT